jgi:hypothetical protein
MRECMRMPSKPLPKHDPVAFTFLLAMALAAAVVAGASLSGVASGAVQDLLRTAGFGQDSEIKAEQRRQALVLAKIETSFGLVRGEVAMLNARIDDAEKSHQEAAISAVKPEVKSEPGRVDSEIDLAALRTSFDEHAERNRNEFIAVNKRIDWLEKLIYNQDATGSVQPASPPPPSPARRHGRQSVQSAPGWFVLHAEKGVAVIAGKGGTIDVTPGFVVPDLGRVAAIRQQSGHWVVVMDKGVTIRER